MHPAPFLAPASRIRCLEREKELSVSPRGTGYKQAVSTQVFSREAAATWDAGRGSPAERGLLLYSK